jgi:hypothetical protein
MRHRRTLAAVFVALAVASCGGGGELDDSVPAPDAPLTPYVNVVDKADDLADQVNQHTSDLEGRLQP